MIITLKNIRTFYRPGCRIDCPMGLEDFSNDRSEKPYADGKANSVKYRPEIDGLRAVAVVPVILFHAGVPAFSGGYIGVDIFFVISGYLITSILIGDIRSQQFSILSFYERRIKRILPALCVVMLATLLPAYLLLLPTELEAYGRSLIAVPLFASNVLFWSERGYFGASVDLKPLVHTWSLAVEEQFYIFFPPLLAFLANRSKKFSGAVLGFIFIISLTASWYLTRLHFETAFYLPFTRIWELMVGSACAHALAHPTFAVRRPGWPLALAGTALIGYSIFNFDNATVFPGVIAALPVGGTAMVILARPAGNPLVRLLASRPLVGIGLISYSLYLWHQPVFAFLRHLGHHEPAALSGSVPLIVVLSYLTYRLVESPVRRNPQLTRRKVFASAGLVGGLFVACGAAMHLTQGFVNRYPAADVRIMTQFEQVSAYSEAAYNAAQFRPFDTSGRRKVVIAGDSHARDFYNMVRESGLEQHYQFSTKRINAECGNLMVEQDLSAFIPPLREERCRVMGRLDHPKLQALLREADEVWLTARWFEWVIDYLPETIANLEKTYRVKVRVFGPKHFGNIDLKGALAIPASQRTAHTQAADPYFVEMNERLRSKVSPTHLTELLDPFCQGHHDTCRLFTDEGLIVTIDGGHISEAGAKFLAPTLRRLIESAP